MWNADSGAALAVRGMRVARIPAWGEDRAAAVEKCYRPVPAVKEASDCPIPVPPGPPRTSPFVHPALLPPIQRRPRSAPRPGERDRFSPDGLAAAGFRHPALGNQLAGHEARPRRYPAHDLRRHPHGAGRRLHVRRAGRCAATDPPAQPPRPADRPDGRTAPDGRLPGAGDGRLAVRFSGTVVDPGLYHGALGRAGGGAVPGRAAHRHASWSGSCSAWPASPSCSTRRHSTGRTAMF